MTLQLRGLREALIDAGSNPDKAETAAEEAAGYEGRLAALEGGMTLLKWVLAFNLALAAAVLLKLFH